MQRELGHSPFHRANNTGSESGEQAVLACDDVAIVIGTIDLIGCVLRLVSGFFVKKRCEFDFSLRLDYLV